MRQWAMATADAEQAHAYRKAGYWTDERLPDWLAGWADTAADRVAVLHGDRSLSYGQLRDQAARLAGGLSRLGIRPGDVISVQLPNIPEFVVAYMAISWLGGVMHTLHMPYRTTELTHLLTHSGSRAVICLPQFRDFEPAAALVGAMPELPLEHVIVVGGEVAGAHAFGALFDYAANFPAYVGSADDPFLLLYTSGTTASPKGVPLTHRAFLANTRLSVPELRIESSERLLSLAPFTHLYGLFVTHLCLCAGATNVLLPAFTPPDFGDVVAGRSVNGVFAAPAHLAASMQAGILDSHDFSSVRFTCLSGSPVPPNLAESVDGKLSNGGVLQLWGMSELQAGSYTRPDEPPDIRWRTAGAASPGTELRIVDDAGEDLEPEREGELQVRGCSVFAGYLDNPEESGRAFAGGGWFRTGDLAMLTRDGQLVITGRVKEIINRGGVKYNPVDVEAVINQREDVLACAIVPVSDPVLGERACLFVVPAEGAAVTLDAIVGHLADRQVAKYKWPERLEIVEAMPLTPTQKIMRAQLRARLTSEGS